MPPSWEIPPLYAPLNSDVDSISYVPIISFQKQQHSVFFFSPTKDNRLLQAAINLCIVHKIYRTLGRKQLTSYFNICKSTVWRENRKKMLVYLLLVKYFSSPQKDRECPKISHQWPADVVAVPMDEHRWVFIWQIFIFSNILYRPPICSISRDGTVVNYLLTS